MWREVFIFSQLFKLLSDGYSVLSLERVWAINNERDWWKKSLSTPCWAPRLSQHYRWGTMSPTPSSPSSSLGDFWALTRPWTLAWIWLVADWGEALWEVHCGGGFWPCYRSGSGGPTKCRWHLQMRPASELMSHAQLASASHEKVTRSCLCPENQDEGKNPLQMLLLNVLENEIEVNAVRVFFVVRHTRPPSLLKQTI